MASLIGFDKNRENVVFRGHSKLSINFMSNYLYVEPENEKYKLISASFNWTYVKNKNLLFVFADFNFLDFCLVFKNEQICKKIYDYIASGKKDVTERNEKRSIDYNFITPFFQEIIANPDLSIDLIETVAKWYQILEESDKERYSNLMKECFIYDLITTSIKQEQSNATFSIDKTNRKRKFVQVKNEEMLENETVNRIPSSKHTKIIPFLQYQLISNSYLPRIIIFTNLKNESFHQFKCKRFSVKAKNPEFKCISCEQTAIIDVTENGEICAKTEARKHLCKTSTAIPESFVTMKLIKKPEFEILENCAVGSKRLLIIFDPENRDLCYEYFCSSKTSQFRCRGCYKNKKIANVATLVKPKFLKENTEEEYFVAFNETHVCQKRKYAYEKFQPIYNFVLKPDFEIQKCLREGKEAQRLIIFDAKNRTKFYQYSHDRRNKFLCSGCSNKGKCVFAKLQQNMEGDEYVILSNAKHVCEMRTCLSNIVLHPPEIYVLEETADGKPKLFLFLQDDYTKCYVFSKFDTNYYCLGCNSVLHKQAEKKIKTAGVRVAGKLLKDKGTGKYSFQMKENQIHCCEPRPYQPEKYEIIPKTSDFYYYRLKQRPEVLKVAVLSSKDKEFCFTFSNKKNKITFFCIECQKNKKEVTIRLQKDVDGKEYYEHNIKKHICKPVKASTISEPKYKIVKEHGLNLKSKSENQPQFDDSKIVKLPYFELRPNKIGVPDKKLIIQHPMNKNLCFGYYFDNCQQMFICFKCKIKKKNVIAKFHKDENGERCILMGKNNHVCQSEFTNDNSEEILNPKRKIRISENKILKPNFELRPNKDGVPDRKLILIHPTNNALSYEYCYSSTNQNFQCLRCRRLKKYVHAKLHNDDTKEESFIMLGNNDHICEPFKYQSPPKSIILRDNGETRNIIIDKGRKVVKKPNYELHPNRAGIPDRKLIILHPNDKSLCYEYFFDKLRQIFKCSRCIKKSNFVTAKLHKTDKNEEESFVVMGNKDHICQPFKYRPR